MENYKLSDEELVVLANSGADKEDALLTLMNRYKHAVISVARAYFLNGGDTDDLVQEGMIGVFRAISTYDKNKGQFSSYAFLCIKSGILTAVKRGNSLKNSPLKNYVSISGLDDDSIDKTLVISDLTFDPAERVIGKEAETELKILISKTLSKLEYNILVYYLDGYSYTEIGDKMNKPIKSVDNAIQRIKRKISNKILEINMIKKG